MLLDYSSQVMLPTVRIVQARVEVEASPGIDAGQVSGAHEGVDHQSAGASMPEPLLQLLGKVCGSHAAEGWCHLDSTHTSLTATLVLPYVPFLHKQHLHLASG